MINPVSVIMIAFIITLLGLMYYSLVTDGYETPASVRVAAYQVLKSTAAAWFGLALANLAFNGLDFATWKFDFFLGFALGGLIRFAVDCYQINKRGGEITE